MDIEKEVKDIIVEQLGTRPEDVILDAKLAEHLKADDLEAVDLVMALEEKFNITIPDEDAEKFHTVKDIVDYIREKTENKS